MNRAIFLDRDGVINIDKNYVHKIEDFEFIDGTIGALRGFKALGYKIIVITNQSGIGRGFYSIKDYRKLKRFIDVMLGIEGIIIDDEFFCPHSPDESCRCRKPNTYFIDKAIKKFDIDITKSYIVGDKTSDILAGKNAKLKTVLVKTGKAGKDKKHEVMPDLTFENLYEFSKYIKDEWTPKVLYVGNFNWENHLRGRNLFTGLKENNVDVNLVLGKGLGYLKVISAILKKDYDVILTTGKPTTLLAIMTRFFHKKKIVFDVYISDYENLVENVKTVKKNSLKAKLLWFIDAFTARKSDVVFLDTKEHAKWYYERFNLDKNKFTYVLIGSDDKRFHYIKTNKSKRFIVLFFGSFIRGHGIDVMLKAAKILEKYPIEFVFAGKGVVFDEMVELSKNMECKNVKFLGWIEQKKLPEIIAKADVTLGVFDANEKKILKSIPTKLFEVAPMKKVFITGRTPAVIDVIKHKENGMLCELGDEKELASCIKEIYEDKDLKKKIESNVYKMYKDDFTTKNIGKELLKIIKNLF